MMSFEKYKYIIILKFNSWMMINQVSIIYMIIK